MNWLDFVILIIFVLYVWSDYCRGFLRLCADFIGLILAFIIALRYYSVLTGFIVGHSHINFSNAQPLAFLIIWLLTQTIFFGLSKIISYYTPRPIKDSNINKYLAIFPALAKGFIFIIVVIILVMASPVSNDWKNQFKKSLIFSLNLKYAIGFEDRLEKIFGGSNDSLATVSKNNFEPDETKDLQFATREMKIDLSAEKIIFTKINEERSRLGLKVLVEDPQITEIARAHSKDMLINGYFSHTSKDGRTLFDRFIDAKIMFQKGAENIALAPSAELTHMGLMNSQKHKDNILNPEFTRVGVGVMNAGKYGLMTTEDFAN